MGGNAMKTRLGLWAAAAATVFAVSVPFALSALADPFVDPRADTIAAIEANPGFTGLPRDPACQAPVLLSTGGKAPQNRHTLAVRWTGFANYELAYNGRIILLDTFFDRGSNYPPLGFKAADVKKADVILLGHAHFDH